MYNKLSEWDHAVYWDLRRWFLWNIKVKKTIQKTAILNMLKWYYDVFNGFSVIQQL